MQIFVGFAAVAVPALVIAHRWGVFDALFRPGQTDTVPAPTVGWTELRFPIRVIRIVPSSGKETTPSHEKLKVMLDGAAKIWKQYGIALQFDQIEDVVNDKYLMIDSTEHGTGEIKTAISDYYRSEPVLIFTENLGKYPDGQTPGGITSNDLRVAAIWTDTSATIAHELGHVFIGLGHPDLHKNLMMAGVSDHIFPGELPWLNRPQVDAARKRIEKNQWLRE